MSPYEITQAGGSVEHMNREPGAAWLNRLLEAYPHAVWLNPQPQERLWDYTPSIEIIRQADLRRPDGAAHAGKGLDDRLLYCCAGVSTDHHFVTSLFIPGADRGIL